MQQKAKDLEKKVQSLIVQEIPDFYENYQIIIKTADEVPDINGANVNNIVFHAFFYHKRFPYPSSVLSMLDMVMQLAKIYKEKRKLEELEGYYNGKGVIEFKEKTQFIPLCLVEAQLAAAKYNPKYQFMSEITYNGEKWRIFELEELLAVTRTKVFKILQEIITKYEITTKTDYFGGTTQNIEQTEFPEMATEVVK